MLMFGIGFATASIIMALGFGSYKRVLQMVGEEGGTEKINGKWYRITKAQQGSDE